MAQLSEVQEGDKVRFQHKIGGAGEMSDTEKVGKVLHVERKGYDFPVKVEILGTDRRIVTYIEPSEITDFINS